MAARHFDDSGFIEWSPVIDGVELTDDPRKLMASGAREVVLYLLQRTTYAVDFMRSPSDHH